MSLSLAAAYAHDDATARYLANAGVLVAHGDAKIVFDPLYRSSYDRYELVPDAIERALFAGASPYDDIDAVFISHYHGDHFTADVMLEFLDAQDTVHLYAPAQAVAALEAAGAGEELLSRVTAVDLRYGDAPVVHADGELVVEAVGIPHSGWPTRMTDVQNIAWRVTLDGAATVVHLGDADTKPEHYDLHPTYWSSAKTDLALPPYWYFLSPNGRLVLESRIRARHAIGVHVPGDMPDDRAARPAEIREFDLFTIPGEERVFSHGEEDAR